MIAEGRQPWKVGEFNDENFADEGEPVPLVATIDRLIVVIYDHATPSSGALHYLKTIVHPMLSQFYGVFHSFRLSCETKVVIEFKFPLFPGDNRTRSPHTFFAMSKNRDCVAMMYDLLHLES
jgi:hypothetical protein